MKIIRWIAGITVAAIAALAIWLYAPDKPRAALEAAYPGEYRTVDGTRLRLRDTGPRDGPAVILLHGFGASLETWEGWARPLSARYRVIRFDLPGFGLTGADPTGDYSDARAVQLMAGLMDQLGVARASVIGNSLGGRIAWTFAAQQPDRVERLVLCDTAAVIGPASVWNERVAGIRKSGLAAIAPGVMERWFTAPFRAANPVIMQGCINMVARNTLDGYVGCALAVRDADLRADGARIAAPTLVIVGDQDPATPPA
ncbi:MAG: hypothetical protein B7Y31_03415, partial [Novosphingobium sp. 16-62-11]